MLGRGEASLRHVGTRSNGDPESTFGGEDEVGTDHLGRDDRPIRLVAGAEEGNPDLSLGWIVTHEVANAVEPGLSQSVGPAPGDRAIDRRMDLAGQTESAHA